MGFRWSIAAAVAATTWLAGSPAIGAAGDPVAFAKTLYALPELWTSMAATADGRSQYLAPALARLVIDENSDFRDYLDYDPLADSRPYLLSDETFTLAKVDEFGTWVKVDFKNNNRPDTVTLRLVSAGDRWRLADIDFPDGRTLVRDLLQASLCR